MYSHQQARGRWPVDGGTGAAGTLALVVGTTGELPLDDLRAYAAIAPVGISTSFNTGVPLLLSMLGACKGALPAGWHAEVAKTHRTAESDTPSDTAKRVAAALGEAGVEGSAATVVPTCLGIPVRLRGNGGTDRTHAVILAGHGERVEATHVLTRPEELALGALRTAAWAVAQGPGLYIK
jgi:dihydrodipicolinate reductase